MLDLNNQNIIHIKREDIEYIQFKRLLEYENILKHYFILKCEEFNYKNDMQIRYKNICTELGLNQNSIIKIKQTHSDNIKIVDRNCKNNFYNSTDGLITKDKDVILPIQVADCIPIFLFDPNKKIIANIHSGWRGTKQRIIEKAINKMVTIFKCNTYDIICCIGPCIGKCHFEVSKDVKDMFEQEFKNMLNKDIIEKSRTLEDKYFIDTVLINRLILQDMGLKDVNIIESNICTVCNNKNIHSYRTEKEKSGRNLSIITLI